MRKAESYGSNVFNFLTKHAFFLFLFGKVSLFTDTAVPLCGLPQRFAPS